MSAIDPTLKLKYYDCSYGNPKTLAGGVVGENASAEGNDFALIAYRKSDLIGRETDEDVTIATTVESVDGEAPTGDLVGANGWENILDDIDLTKCPYNEYEILLRKNVGETTTYDVFVNIMDDVVAPATGYQIASANGDTESIINLFYDDVDTSVLLRTGGSTGTTDTGGSAPYVILENKYLPFGSVTLNPLLGIFFTETIVISRTYTYGTGALPFIKFSNDVLSASEDDEAQTFSLAPAGSADSVTELDDILTYYSLSYLKENFFIFCALNDTVAATYGPMIGIEMPIVYFNVPFSTTAGTSKVYISGSEILASVPFEISYTPGETPIAGIGDLEFNNAKIRFIEDGVDIVDVTGEDFDCVYDSDSDSYVFKAPYGDPPPSTPEGYLVAGSTYPTAVNGNYWKTEVIVNGANVYKHETQNYYIKVGSASRIILSNSESTDGDPYFITSEPYNSIRGMNLLQYTWGSYYYGSGTLSFGFIEEVKESGEKTLSIVLYDEYGNRTSPTTPLVIILSIVYASFTNMYLKLVGSSGSSDYTGFYTKNSRFFPTDYVTMLFYCESLLDFQYKITGDVKCDDTYYDFSGSGIKRRVLRLNVSNANTSILNVDKNVEVEITFRDVAGNTTMLADTIRYISKLHNFPMSNLRPDSESYQTELYRVEGNLTTSIPKRRVSTSEYARSWNDVFWPSNHQSPLDSTGEIDVNEAIRISQTTIDETGNLGPTTEELLNYDRLVLLTDGAGFINDALQEDNEGRYNTVWNPNKRYGSMTNAYGSTDGTGLTYFIIDNSGYSNFRLEFEWFDFDSGVTKLPRNILSPYDGDVLVVYDASDPDAVESVLDIYGNESYILKDSTKLTEIYAFTGSYLRDDIEMKNSGVSSITKVANGFVTPAITTTSRICLIPYTDSTGNGSGFKLRGGERHNVEYTNYDIDCAVGNVWIHESPVTLNDDWRGADTVLANGQNYTSVAVVDLDKSVVEFSERQIFPVLANYTHYDYLFANGTNQPPKDYFSREAITKYLTYYDDLVDYNELIMSVVPSGTTADFVSIYDYLDVAKDFGKIVGGFTNNKDLGLIEFTGNVPLGRIIGSYYYHTLYRLTNDGYGDLYFYNSSLVPDSSVLSYTDWTYVDLKIINEGTNALTNGVLKFLTRGYVSSDQTVDRVLNNNRPWDVQIGTDAETVNCTGALVSTQISTFATPSRSVAYGARASQSAAFGTLLPKASTFVRVYWCLSSNAEGSAYVETTRGRKLYSAELSGRYYTLITG